MARFTLYGRGVCLSPVVSLCGKRVVDCGVSGEPVLGRMLSVMRSTAEGVGRAGKVVLRSSRK